MCHCAIYTSTLLVYMKNKSTDEQHSISCTVTYSSRQAGKHVCRQTCMPGGYVWSMPCSFWNRVTHCSSAITQPADAVINLERSLQAFVYSVSFDDSAGTRPRKKASSSCSPVPTGRHNGTCRSGYRPDVVGRLVKPYPTRMRRP